MITLPILFYTDESEKLAEVGVHSSSNEVRDMLFLNINAISPCKDSKGEISETIIHSNGDSFVCPLRYEVFKERIMSLNSFYYSPKYN